MGMVQGRFPGTQVQDIVLQKVITEGMMELIGGWHKIFVLATFGSRDKLSPPCVVCRGEVYMIHTNSTGRWEIPNNPEEIIKGILFRVTKLLISDPEEFMEAFRMFGRVAIGHAQSPTKEHCEVLHL